MAQVFKTSHSLEYDTVFYLVIYRVLGHPTLIVPALAPMCLNTYELRLMVEGSPHTHFIFTSIECDFFLSSSLWVRPGQIPCRQWSERLQLKSGISRYRYDTVSLPLVGEKCGYPEERCLVVRYGRVRPLGDRAKATKPQLDTQVNPRYSRSTSA